MKEKTQRISFGVIACVLCASLLLSLFAFINNNTNRRDVYATYYENELKTTPVVIGEFEEIYYSNIDENLMFSLNDDDDTAVAYPFMNFDGTVSSTGKIANVPDYVCLDGTQYQVVEFKWREGVTDVILSGNVFCYMDPLAEDEYEMLIDNVNFYILDDVEFDWECELTSEESFNYIINFVGSDVRIGYWLVNVDPRTELYRDDFVGNVIIPHLYLSDASYDLWNADNGSTISYTVFEEDTGEEIEEYFTRADAQSAASGLSYPIIQTNMSPQYFQQEFNKWLGTNNSREGFEDVLFPDGTQCQGFERPELSGDLSGKFFDVSKLSEHVKNAENSEAIANILEARGVEVSPEVENTGIVSGIILPSVLMLTVGVALCYVLLNKKKTTY